VGRCHGGAASVSALLHQSFSVKNRSRSTDIILGFHVLNTGLSTQLIGTDQLRKRSTGTPLAENMHVPECQNRVGNGQAP
jgi:hypothetical protein